MARKTQSAISSCPARHQPQITTVTQSLTGGRVLGGHTTSFSDRCQKSGARHIVERISVSGGKMGIVGRFGNGQTPGKGRAEDMWIFLCTARTILSSLPSA